MYAQPSAALENTPLGRDAQQWLRSCVHCGFCLATCPTYQVTGNELDGPRGRIYLVKQLVEGGAIGEPTREHLDRCLTCRACETACPSGVEYGRLLDVGRQLVEVAVPRTMAQRAARTALSEVLAQRRVFAALLRCVQVLRPCLPAALRARVPARDGRIDLSRPALRHTRRVILLEGCVQPALAPGINAAAARVLDRLGISTVRVRGEGCCGALSQHLGREARALDQIRRNVDALGAALAAGAETIVSTASGCGVTVKDYGQLLRADPRYAERAKIVAAATRDLAEVVTPADLHKVGVRSRTGAVVAWQNPCTLQHGQKLRGRVEALLKTLGCRLSAAPGTELCCGAAGTYALLQPAMSVELRTRKLGTLAAGQPEVIVTANIGCLEHLRTASTVPVRHWIELVDEQLRGRDLDDRLPG
jgi:glycolate oxidase iron-sulfur subunit